jgi:RNA recognition motif-containing protein
MSTSVASTVASTVSSHPASYCSIPNDRPKKILVQNVSTFTTETDLRSLFQRYGRVAFVHLPLNQKGERRFIALVQFVRADDAALAMVALQGARMDYMILRLEWAKPKQKTLQKTPHTKTKNVPPSVAPPSKIATGAKTLQRPHTKRKNVPPRQNAHPNVTPHFHGATGTKNLWK